MTEEAFYEVAEGAWAVTVVVVVSVGGVANIAVIIRWLTARPNPDTLATALPFVDLLVCLLAAPLRYAQKSINTNIAEQLLDYNAQKSLYFNVSDQLLDYYGNDIMNKTLSSPSSITGTLPNTSFIPLTVYNTSSIPGTLFNANSTDMTLSNGNSSVWAFSVNSTLTTFFNTSTTFEIPSNGNSSVGTVSSISNDCDFKPCNGVCEAGHLVVVVVCASSLHVVAVVAFHRVTLLTHRFSSLLVLLEYCCSPLLAFLTQCWPSLPSYWPPLPPHSTVPIVVAGLALLGSTIFICSLHSTGNFTGELPILGVRHLLPEGTIPSAIVVAFLCYLAMLCCLVTLCYLGIIAALLHQRCIITTTTCNREIPLINTTDGVVNISTREDPLPNESQCGSGEGRQEQAVRACITVGAVIVTLSVCWTLPIALALYSLLIQPSLLPTLPYSDALILLSALVHPFVYGEGWGAMLACLEGLYHIFAGVTQKLTITNQIKSKGSQKREVDKSSEMEATQKISEGEEDKENTKIDAKKKNRE